MKFVRVSIVILIIVCLILGGWYIFSQQSKFVQHNPFLSPSVTSMPSSGHIIIRGQFVCLPHRNSTGPQTMECAYGLKDSAGRYFALRDSDPAYQNISKGHINSEVEIQGNFIPQMDNKYPSIGVITVTNITLLSTSPSPTSQLPTRYISAVDWPPKVTVEDRPFNCIEAGSEIERAGQTKKVLINNNTYCVTKVTEGAAGSIYTQYAYARAKDNQTQIFTFSLRFVQCGNYSEPEKTACEKERQTFSINTFIDTYIQGNF